MSQKKNNEDKFMPKSTAYLSIALALFIGIFIGTYFGPNTGSQSNEIQRQVLGSSGSTNANNSLLEQIEVYEANVAEDPTNANDWGTLGNLYFDAHMHEEAIEAYQQSLSLAPNNVGIITDMGTMYRAVGNFEEALAAYDRALAINPDHQQSRYNRGIVLTYDLGRTQEAINNWKIFMQKFPNALAPDGRTMAVYIEELENQSTN